MSTAPHLTVLMPVYNAEAYLREAMESILTQTYGEFEFLIVDDGSSDNSVAIVQEYKDPRIRLIQNENNMKLFGIYNMAMHEARGTYLAYMHSDDIAEKRRFETQLAFLAQNPDIDVVGSYARLFGTKQKPLRFIHPLYHDNIHIRLLLQCTLFDPSVVMRRQFLLENNLQYDLSFHPVSDYEFWSRATQCGRFANIPEMLLNYRVHENQTSNPKNDLVAQNAMRVRRNLITCLGFEPTDAEMQFHETVRTNNLDHILNDETFLDQACDWFDKLLVHNAGSGVYRHDLLAGLFQDKLTFWSHCLEQFQTTLEVPVIADLMFFQDQGRVL